MCYTGVCIRSLNATVLELLITQVIKMMDEEDFLNVLLVGWIPEITRFLIKSKGSKSIALFMRSLKKIIAS